MHTNILRRTHTNAHSIERHAQRSCQCGFIFLLIDTSCETLRHAHMCARIQSDCTCHLSWIVLPLPHFVLPVHHLYSSSAVSSMGSCETLLSVCVWKVFSACCLAPLCPPSTLLSCSGPVEMIHCICLWLCVFECAWVSVYTAARPHSTFTQKKIVFSSSLPFALLSGSCSVSP